MIGRPAHDQRPATQYLSLEHSVHQQRHSCKLLPGDGVGEEAGWSCGAPAALAARAS